MLVFHALSVHIDTITDIYIRYMYANGARSEIKVLKIHPLYFLHQQILMASAHLKVEVPTMVFPLLLCHTDIVEIPENKVDARQEIETLINEEALLFAKYLRNERPTWIPRIAELK